MYLVGRSAPGGISLQRHVLHLHIGGVLGVLSDQTVQLIAVHGQALVNHFNLGAIFWDGAGDDLAAVG
jgi:hypothetical protein